MKKRILALVLVLAVSLSCVSFAGVPGTDEAVPDIYAYDFYFRNSSSEVLKSNVSGDITAEVYAKLTDKDIDMLDVTLSIFVYYNNSIIAAESMDATVTPEASQIKTPAVTIESEKADKVTVKAMLTTKDFNTLLAPVAVLGSSLSDIDKITVGEYNIPLEENVYEYDITRFFKAEEITPELKAYPEDLSSDIEITSSEDNGIITYSVKSISCDTTTDNEYTINLTPVTIKDTQLAGVEIGGKAIADFSPDKKEYTIAVMDGSIPVLTAYKFNSDAVLAITNATELPGTTTVKVSCDNNEETYKFNFIKPTTVSLTSDTTNSSHPFGYQYRSSASKVSAGTRATLYLVTKDADYATAGNYVCYAAFDTSSLGEFDLTGNIDIKTKQNYTYDSSVDIYNSTFDDSTGIKDEYAEIKSKTAKLLGTFSAGTNNNVISVAPEDITICENGNIVLVFTKQYDEETKDKTTVVNEAKLEITYLPKNLSKLSENGFDISLIEKPVKPEVVKGNAFVTAENEWADEDGNTLLKIDIDAEFPAGCSDKNVLIKVLKPGISESDSKTLEEKYAYVYTALTDEDGKLNESFNLSVDAGTYTIVVSCNGYEKNISCTVDIPSADKMNALIKGLKEKTYDKDTLSKFISDNLSGLSLTNSLFAKFVESTRVNICEYIIDNIKSYTAGGFSEVLKEGSVLLGINPYESNENIISILSEDEIAELISVDEKYDDYVAVDKNGLASLMKSGSYTSYQSIATSVYENIFILLLKQSLESDDITEVINRYRAYMSANCYNKYKGMSEEDIEAVNGKILSSLSDIEKISQLEEIIILNLPDKIAVTEPSKTVNTYGFEFKDEAGSEVIKAVSGKNVKAEVYAELSDPEGSEIPSALTIMTYKEGTLLSAKTSYYTITKDAQLISTDFVNIASEDTTVKVILTAKDMTTMLSPAAVLGSADSKINAIYVGNYKLPLEEGKNEYSLTRYFDENEPVKLRAYANDFSAKIDITEKEENGIISYEVKSTSSDNSTKEEYKINLKAYEVNSASLVGVDLNGKAILDFSPEVKEYYVGIKGSVVPEVTAYKFNNKAQVTVTNASSIPGTTVINVTNGEASETYKINFISIKNATLAYSDFLCRAGNNGNKNEWTVRASSEPMIGNSSKVLYFLFDFNTLGNIHIRDVKISGTVDTAIKLYFYNSSYSTIEQANSYTESGFKEIYDGLVSYLGEYKFGKGETASVTLDINSLEIKDNTAMIMVRKKYGDTNATDYGQFKGAELKLEYIVKPSDNTVVSELSDKGFDISVLDKGELTYSSSYDANISIDKKWVGEGTDTKLKLTLNADFSKDSANQKIYIRALRPDMSDASELSTYEKYAYITSAYLDEDGKATVSIDLSETSGEYNFIVSCENSEDIEKCKVYIPGTDKITELIKNLQDGKYTKETLYQYITDNKSELSLDGSNIINLTSATGKIICQHIIDNIGEYTVDGFNKVLSEGLVICGINSNESSANIEKLLLEQAIYPSLSEDENYKDYTGLSDRTTLLNNIKSESYEKVDDVKNSFYQNLLIVKLKEITSYTSFEAIVDAYSSYIDSDIYEEYDKLSKDDRAKVNVTVSSELKNVDNITDLEKEIEDAIDKLSEEDDSDSGRGSGGVGGGGLGNITTSSPVITAPQGMNFKDVSKDFWGYSAIKSLYDKKIVAGKTETEFCPEDNVTRAEFTKMLVVALGMTGSDDYSKFTDVQPEAWYYDYVNKGVANGIIQGMSETQFAPDWNISRQDASVMINRILKLEQTTEDLFGDDGYISDYAKASVYALKENNIIKGYEGNFNPLDNLTRVEAAVLINNILNVVNK